MDPSGWNWVAVYAAAVATLSVGWQVFTWARGRASRLKVTVKPAVLTPQGLGVVCLTAMNESQHPLRVTSAGLEAQDGSGATVPAWEPFPGGELPHVIPPHDEHPVFMELDGLRSLGFDFRRPVVAYFGTAEGRFRSRPTRLFSR
jgi:hypothetical protein